MKRLQRQRKSLSSAPGKERRHSAILSRRSSAAHPRVNAGRLAHSASRSSIREAVVTHPPQVKRSDAQFQIAVRNFELGARAFQKRHYERAKEIFAKLAATTVVGVAERARVHLRLCEQKLRGPSPPPRSVEDLYAAGVGALNARRLDDAVTFLAKARKAAPRLEHVQYALAAAHALRREADAALQHLKQAILLRPGNRIQARHDEDFRSLAGDVRFGELVWDSNSPHLPGFEKPAQHPQPAT